MDFTSVYKLKWAEIRSIPHAVLAGRWSGGPCTSCCRLDGSTVIRDLSLWLGPAMRRGADSSLFSRRPRMAPCFSAAADQPNSRLSQIGEVLGFYWIECIVVRLSQGRTLMTFERVLHNCHKY